MRVTITVGPGPTDEAATEWVLVEPVAPVLDPSVRDRLVRRLSSRRAQRTLLERITGAFQAGASTAGRDLRTQELVHPPPIGLSNSCWLGIKVDGSVSGNPPAQAGEGHAGAGTGLTGRS